MSFDADVERFCQYYIPDDSDASKLIVITNRAYKKFRIDLRIVEAI